MGREASPVRRAVGEHPAWLAALRLVPGTQAPAEWIATCYRVTPRVERLAASCALLDLGMCAEDEARALLRSLLRHLAWGGVPVRAGIGPSRSLAELAAFRAPEDEPLRLVSAAEAPAFLRAMPVSALAQLHPAGLVPPEVIERLERFGLRTLGQVARIGEGALRRQFGGSIGTVLAAVSCARDERPLHPTPPAVWESVQLGFTPAASPERALAALPGLAKRIALRLREQGRSPRALRLSLRWESGSIQRRQLALRAATNDPALLDQELRRLFFALLQTHQTQPPLAAIEKLAVGLGDCAPSTLEQASMWRTQAQRRAAVQVMADTLTRRHGRPLLMQSRLAVPAAIFTEERYRLAPPAAGGAREEGRGVPGIAAAEQVTSPWQHVPQRLHWW
ncbi:MAG: hypothetical protein PVSMB4_10320 [Ktedonobacterales bacterium]